MIPLPKLIDQNGNEIGRIAPILASVNLNIVPLSSATLQLKKGDTIQTRALVEMFTINGSAGVFRARAPQYGYGDMLTTVELEHSISMLGDFIVTDDIEEQTTASAAIVRLFGYYRGGMWVLGQNSVSSTVVMQTNHDSVLDSLMAIMEQIPGYMLSFDQSVFPWRLNIVERPATVTAEGRLSRNISSVQIIYDDSELCTRAYMAWLDGTEAITYQNADTISTYGIVEKEISGYGEVDQATAQRIVNLYLSKHKNPKMSVEISAVDFSEVTGETFDKFTLGSMFRLAMPDENVTVEEIITGLRFDDIYNMPYDAAITLAEAPDTVVNIIHEQEKAGGGFGAGGRLKKEEKEFKRFETFYTQTDEKFSWLATDSEWDELAQVGHVTAFTELTRTAHFVEDTAQKELPFDEWKPKWIIAHPEDASLPDSELLVKYQNWITTNPYAIYNNEYSDATRTERIISKTGINSLGANETLTSRIAQEAGRIDLVVEGSGANAHIKPASIVAAINGASSSVIISADHIELDGDTIVTELYGKHLEVGSILASSIESTELMIADVLRVNEGLTIDGADVSNAIDSIGPASASGGQIHIPWTRLDGSSGSVNFNIADYVSALIVDGNDSPVSGQRTLAGGSTITLYPATYINGVTGKNTSAALIITAADGADTVTLASYNTSEGSQTATTEEIKFLDKSQSGNSLNVRVGVRLSNGKQYSRTMTGISFTPPTPTLGNWQINSDSGGGTKVWVDVNGTTYSHVFNNYP